MTDRTLRVLGGVALALLVAEVLLLGVLLPLDQAVWLRVLLVRGCTTDRTIEQLVWSAGLAMWVLGGVAVLLHGVRRGWAATWPFVALFAVGALLNGILKDLLFRARPSNLPGLVEGNGFPSGHVMNTVLAMLIVFGLAASFRRAWLWRLLAAICTGIVAAGRLLYGAHWFLDVVGGALAALALVGLCLPMFRRQPFMAPAVLAAVLGAILGLHAFAPGVQVGLPSPLTGPGDEFLDVEIAAPTTSSNLTGHWSGRAHEEPAGGLAWVQGVGGVSVFETTWVEAAERAEAGDDTVELPPVATGEGPGELFVLVARPDETSETCSQVRIAVNGHIVAGFVPFEGWREYRFPLPSGTYRRGFNEIQLAVRALDGTPQRLAVSRFRLRLR